MPFAVRNETTDRTHRLVPTGELDIVTAPILEDAFDAVYDPDSEGMVVLDLTELSFMDSTGIHLLLRLTETCKAADRLRIINGSPAVERVLDVSGVRSVLPIMWSDDDPVAGLEG